MKWMQKCYSRLLIDNHITDLKPEFMRRFDPTEYVRMVKMAGVDSAMVYACCHNGNCYYPTKVGYMHANLDGRDIFGETVDLLRKAGIVPIAYYTSIYHNNSAKAHPAWRITAANGMQHSGRYWWSCPNNDEYAAFAVAQIEEIVSYDVDGVFNDMTFWPLICTCSSCRVKFFTETGLEIPIKIDWRNKEWVVFQRFREKSMADFAHKLTDAAKRKQNISVTHQTSTIMHGWSYAYTLDIASACDYSSGDFYGGKNQHILGAKVLAAVSRKMPYEFMTSRCVDLRDHTSMKSEAELTVEAATTLANAGAYFFIDAINPDGTLEQEVYKRLGRVSESLMPFKEAVQRHAPEIAADKALYYSSPAYVDEQGETKIMSPLPPKMSAVEELAGTAIVLVDSHNPFRVVHANTKNFDGLNTIILNSILYTSNEENERIRKFVADGGTLIATGCTSLCKPDGSSSGDFALADVFGVNATGKSSTSYHYLSFINKRWLVSCNSAAPLVKAGSAKVLAKIIEPAFTPEDKKYASIHSNPPGRETDFPALTVNCYGKGKCIYLASSLLSMKQDAQQSFGKWLLAEFSPSSLVVETNAPPCVEITVLKSTISDSYLVGFVNYQAELPNVPIQGLFAKLRLPIEGNLKSCVKISNGRDIEQKVEDGVITLEISILETIEMFELSF